MAELDAAGAVTAVNTFDGAALVSRRATGLSAFYLFDPQGSVAQRHDSNGAILSSHLYMSHGDELTTPSADPFGYGAQWGYSTDRETGLLLLSHRYYDPTTGRFLTRDPIGYGGGINLYSYVENQPVNFADPSGLERLSTYTGTWPVVPKPPDKEKIAKVRRCYNRNRFSALFSDIPYVHGTMEFLEIGPPISAGGDMIATAAKASGKKLGNPQPYASGLNFLFRRTADLLGNPTVGGKSLKGALVGFGDVVTPPLAVIGTFTFSYNATIDVQCGCGVLE